MGNRICRWNILHSNGNMRAHAHATELHFRAIERLARARLLSRRIVATAYSIALSMLGHWVELLYLVALIG